MCGIAGTVGTVDLSATGAMLAALRHRGPDQEGMVAMGPICLGIARLAIVDPDGGDQPIFNDDRSLCIVFNGEIYNHAALRKQLEAKGHRFFTHSDTEVILRLYEAHGPRCVEMLEGMFCFAITDGRKLFLARDQVGIKPLYYTQVRSANLFLFASEIKALLAVPSVPALLDEVTAADWAVIGHPVGTRTFLSDIHLLGPGETCMLDRDQPMARLQPVRYFGFDRPRDESMSMEAAEAAVLEALSEAVYSHAKTSDGRLGLVLSGGLDSTLLALLLSERKDVRARTYTVANDARHPDVEQARYVADFIGSEHHALILDDDDFLGAIPRFVATEEVPSDMSDMPHYLMSREISRHSKVCINGEGADELFGGYLEFVDQRYKADRFRTRLDRAAAQGLAVSQEAMAYIEPIVSASSYPDYLDRMFVYNRGYQLDRAHLHRVDKLGMAFGLENRVPFLDNRMLDVGTSIPVRHLVNETLGIRKHVLRRILIRRYGVQMLDIALREKLTFPSATGSFADRLGQLCKRHVGQDFIRQHKLGTLDQDVIRLVCFDLFEDIFVKYRGDWTLVGSFPEYLDEKYRARMAKAGEGLAVS